MTIFIFKQGNAFNDNDYDYYGESIFDYYDYDQLLISRAMLAMIIMLISMNQWYGHDHDHYDES